MNDTKEDRTPNANGNVEFSLADLAVRHPHGGKIDIDLGNAKTLVARFASPFRPKLLENPSTPGWRSLDFILGHGVERVRVVCVELCSGRREEFEPRSFDGSDEIIFHNAKAGLPRIRVRAGSRKDPTQSVTGTSLGTSMGGLLETAFRQHPSAGNGSLNTTRLGIDLPISGWPEGLWFVGLEAARNVGDVCECLTGPDGKAAVRLIAAKPSDNSPEILRLVWHAWQQTLQDRSQAWLEWPWTHDALTRAVNIVEAVRAMFPHGFTELLTPDFAWVGLLERAVAGAAENLLKAGDESAPRILLDLARSHKGRLRLLRVPEVLAFPAHVYTALQHREPAFVALRQCAEMGLSARLSQHVIECPEKFAAEFLRGFKNFASIKQYAAKEELSAFDIRKYWQTLIQAPNSAGNFAPVDGCDLLGVSHWQWAWREFRHRYAERQGIEEMGYANACANQAGSLLAFVRSKVDGTLLIPKAVWVAPWPDIETNVNFEENLPHLCSAVALAARVAGARKIAFAEALTALRGNLTPQSFNAGLRALLELTPELLGFFLLFWQSILNTSPHHD